MVSLGKLFLCLALVAAAVFNVQAAKKGDDKDCEVCIKVLTAALEGVSAKDKKTLEKTESAIDKYCNQKELSQTTKKVCYFITPIKREISQPIKNGVPMDRICSRLKKKSSEICSIREAVKVEKGVTDYNKMRVKQLKKILSDRGVSCENCLEKSEFVKRCKDTEHMEL